MGCEMAREGVRRALAREIALEACSVAGKAMARDPDALTDGTLAFRVKREVRSLVFASNRERRSGRDRDESPGSSSRLPVFGWITEPHAPLVAWDMHHTFRETVVVMPKLRRETLHRVREDGFSFAAIAGELGPSEEGVARNIARALADLRTALRDGRTPAEGSDWTPDPDLVLLGRWLADELSHDEESALEDRFLRDDAFYAKTAPVMQIWALPVGTFGVDELDEEDAVRTDRDIGLITDYLGNELADGDRLEVERLLETDVVFYVKAAPLIEIWRAPIDWRAALEHYQANAPEPDARAEAAEAEEADGDEGDPDVMVIEAWLNKTLPEHHDETVSRRLKEDDAFFRKVEPAMRIWVTRKRLRRRLGKETWEELDAADAADAADADVALVADYLAMRLSDTECGKVEMRLRSDPEFALKAAPLLKEWRMPRRFGPLEAA
jgi:hypothetical protein